jgi:hypothetical protein
MSRIVIVTLKSRINTLVSSSLTCCMVRHVTNTVTVTELQLTVSVGDVDIGKHRLDRGNEEGLWES